MLTGSGSLSPKLLACWINSRDTLVLAQRAHRLEIARTVGEQRGGVCPRTTLVLYSQIVRSNYSAGGDAVSC